MKSRVLIKTSVFPASENEVFDKLKELKTLQKVAYPYAIFTPTDPKNDFQWNIGETYSFQFKLFGLIPLGTHTIHVIEFNDHTHTIYTNERNAYVPVWNHRITLNVIDQNSVSYTDKVEIFAVWKTPIIYLWPKCFYAHRQKKWVKLLKQNSI